MGEVSNIFNSGKSDELVWTIEEKFVSPASIIGATEEAGRKNQKPEKADFHDPAADRGNPPTHHTVIFGDCSKMPEIADESVHEVVTSPPYFDAPHDYKGLFGSYPDFLWLLQNLAEECFRVLQQGRIAAINIDDMLVDGTKYPIVADTIRIFMDAGFKYRDHYV